LATHFGLQLSAGHVHLFVRDRRPVSIVFNFSRSFELSRADLLPDGEIASTLTELLTVSHETFLPTPTQPFSAPGFEGFAYRLSGGAVESVEQSLRRKNRSCKRTRRNRTRRQAAH
jgi:hypothetical protein